MSKQKELYAKNTVGFVCAYIINRYFYINRNQYKKLNSDLKLISCIVKLLVNTVEMRSSYISLFKITFLSLKSIFIFEEKKNQTLDYKYI